jgi:hypothetical protein
MVGVHCVITVAAISLDLLRPAADTDAAGSELAPAFSLQISDLRADIDMLALMKADVKLRSFDIVDARAVSRDYVFRNVFCPVVDMGAIVAFFFLKFQTINLKSHPTTHLFPLAHQGMGAIRERELALRNPLSGTSCSGVVVEAFCWLPAPP